MQRLYLFYPGSRIVPDRSGYIRIITAIIESTQEKPIILTFRVSEFSIVDVFWFDQEEMPCPVIDFFRKKLHFVTNICPGTSDAKVGITDILFGYANVGGHAWRNMRKIITFVIVLFVIWGCTSDKETVDNFTSCLNEPEKESYFNLVSFCDQFILSNYPNDPLEDGYRKFLKELFESDPKTWKTDKAEIVEMNSELKRVFGDSYDQSRASFRLKSPITKCLQESNNKRFFLTRRGIKNLLEDKEKAGELSPNILAGAMLANKVDPTKGMNKVVFITEVLWRLLYLNSMKT